jgi:hypothetical protein
MGFIPRDGPSALYADAKADGRLTDQPVIGGMVFIDLFGPGGIGHSQVTHVAIWSRLRVTFSPSYKAMGSRIHQS